MAFFEVNKPLLNTVLISLGIILVVGFLVIVVLKIIRTNREEAEQKKACAEAVANAVQKAFSEINKNQIVMSRNVVYSVGIQGEIAHGRYILKSASSNETKFNIRYNGLVRAFGDGDVLTLAEGDTLCPVSGSVVLKVFVEEPQQPVAQ